MINTISALAKEFEDLIQTERKIPRFLNEKKVSILSILNRHGSVGRTRFSEVLFTENSGDFFGLRVEPFIVDNFTLWVSDTESMPSPPTSFSVEFDMKLFDGFFKPDEIAVLLLAEIDAFSSNKPMLDAIHLLDELLAGMDTELDFRVVQSQDTLFNFIMKEAAYTLGSIIMRATTEDGTDVTSLKCPFEAGENTHYIEVLFIDAVSKVTNMTPNPGGSQRELAATLIQWFLTATSGSEELDRDTFLLDTITQSRDISNSVLYKTRCAAVINNMTSVMFKPFDKYLMAESGGFFAKIKLAGLRSLEEDLWEWKMKVRNVATQDEALNMMRLINNNMSIIDQYIIDNMSTMDPKDVEHWRSIYKEYADLRVQLSSKQVYDRREYGIYVDYLTLQQIGNGSH